MFRQRTFSPTASSSISIIFGKNCSGHKDGSSSLNMDSYQLYKKYSQEELLAQIAKIKDDPRNKQDGFCLLRPYANKQIDMRVWAIRMHIMEREEKMK